ncbi:MAG: transcriptional repressor [Clostridia bacterium]|nr:transcriptional repressor [Clostridia bacterium]
MRGEYSTSQRKAVLEFLKGASHHITPSEILAHLKESGRSISLATIYRTLDKLCSEGIVRKMSMGDGAGSCYQYIAQSDCHSHFHLKCIECGRLIHLSCDFLASMEKHILYEHGFTISTGRTVIYGKCSTCEALKK